MIRKVTPKEVEELEWQLEMAREAREAETDELYREEDMD